MTTHKNISVFGRVQGVGFRFSAKLQADQLGIKGVIRNEDDGSVYIEAEGEKENVEKFITWCYEGPGFAKVEKINIEEGKIQKFVSFEIE